MSLMKLLWFVYSDFFVLLFYYFVDWILLYSINWPQIYRLPASASQVPVLQSWINHYTQFMRMCCLRNLFVYEAEVSISQASLEFLALVIHLSSWDKKHEPLLLAEVQVN